MDTITDVLTGGVIAKAIDDEKIGNWGTLTGIAMGFFHDSDFVLGLFNRQFYLEYRVEFMDVRFLIPGFRLPFVYYVEFDDLGRIRSEGFTEDGRGR